MINEKLVKERVDAIIDRCIDACGVSPYADVPQSLLRNLMQAAWTNGYIAGIEFTTNLIEEKTK